MRLNKGLDPVRGQHLKRVMLCSARNSMAVFSHEQRAVDPLVSPVVADRLGHRQDMSLREGAVERGTTMSACSETDQFVGIADVWLPLIIIALEFDDIDQ